MTNVQSVSEGTQKAAKRTLVLGDYYLFSFPSCCFIKADFLLWKKFIPCCLQSYNCNLAQLCRDSFCKRRKTIIYLKDRWVGTAHMCTASKRQQSGYVG